MLSQLLLFAQEAADQAPPAPGGDPNKPPPAGGWDSMLYYAMLPVMLLVLYMMFMRRPREDVERQKFLASLQKNDEVLTASGILGNVVSGSETEDEVVVKLDDHLRVRMTKNSILRNLSAEKRAKEPK